MIGAALRDDGHDVLALSEVRELEGLDDPDVLELATREHRILVTHDVKDFAPLLREWAEAGRSHAGCILVHGLDHRAYGRLLRGLRLMFSKRPRAEDWQDLALFLSPRSGRSSDDALDGLGVHRGQAWGPVDVQGAGPTRLQRPQLGAALFGLLWRCRGS